jgi:LysM repeat protein
MKIYNIPRSSRIPSRQLQGRRPVPKKLNKSNNLFVSINKIISKIDENPFLFQVLGLSILTIAILISFQSLADFSSTPVSAFNSPYEVRMMTNFKGVGQSVGLTANKIEEIKVQNSAVPIEEKAASLTYTVKSGDTLSNIAIENKISLEELMKINGLDESSMLTVGMSLLTK